MHAIPALWTTLAWLASPASQQPASAPQSQPAHRQVATADTDDVPESSGVVAGRVTPHVYWTHNDSGDGPRVWALRLTPADRSQGVARVLGSVELAGASSKDWEDIAWGPGRRLYVLDGGDNPPCERTDKRIHRFIEPKITLDGPRFSLQVPFETIRFEYPDPQHVDRPARRNEHRYDAECLFVDPASEDVYLVTKRDTAKVPVARVYRLPGRRIRWDMPEALHLLEFIVDVTPRIRRPLDPFNLMNAVCGGDIDPTGTRVVLRNYTTAFEFVLPAGEPLERIFRQTPRLSSLVGEIQGEGICYTLDGGEFITTSEMKEVRLTRCPIFATPCSSAPASRPGP